jgi:3D (Asp-Asp-Asp) domain-containing protein
VTASGARVFYGEVAAPYWIPLYAQVVIPGLGRFVVLDRGAFNDNHLDVYVPWYPRAGVRDWYRGVYWTTGKGW